MDAMTDTENLAIMFTDIVDFTHRTSTQSRKENEQMLRQHDQLLHPLIKAFGGNLVKSIGDAMLITFRSPTDAVLCGMTLLDALFEYNQDAPPAEQISIRVAINVGEVRHINNDVYGEAVNIASRIESQTPGGEVYFSEAVYLSMNRSEITSEEIGHFELKGIPEPIRVYQVVKSNPGHDCPFGGLHRLYMHNDIPELQQPEPRAGGKAFPIAVLLTLILLAGAATWVVVTDPANSQAGDSAGPTAPQTAASGEADATTGLASEQLPAPTATEPETAADDPALATAAPAATPPVADSEQIRQIAEAGAQALADRDAAKAGELAEQLAQIAPDNAALALLRGGHAFLLGDRDRGLEAYRAALSGDPQLAENPLLAFNLVDSLGWRTQPASELITRHPSEAIGNALIERADKEGYWGRFHANRLLAQLQIDHQVDPKTRVMLDLREAEKCQHRQRAVQEAGELRLREALPIIKDWSGPAAANNPCLLEDARAAIAAIEGNQPEPAQKPRTGMRPILDWDY
jgi:class 3 adenylate cyclase